MISSAISPRRRRSSGRCAARADHVPTLSEIVGALAASDAAPTPADVARALARRARRHRPLGAPEADHRRLARRRLGAARQDRARRLGARCRSTRSRRFGTGCAALRRAVRLARGAGAAAGAAAAADLHPLMLAQPLEEAELGALDPAVYRAEWKWDGIRVQLVARGGREAALFALRRRYRTGLSRDRRGDARRRRARRRAAGVARRRGQALQRSAAAPQPQDAVAKDAGGVSRLGAALRHARGRGRGSPSAAVRRAPAAARGVVWRARREPLSTSRRSFPSRPGTSSRRCATARAPRRSRG